ncbi:sodium/potassium-transporting ATPase subunit beta-like [Homarus americanus]|uniref:Sodium/potassium-transporting ATPase subunit beta-like n=1 Tax=Homarus americanus TaxID=6706 RepID=A0A8J5JQS6_HOMAM|nr:sodium/potassium-transporting ATPase subunit beta-like [Homarus americanus]KAG7159434.1 Sodium/potassium-transporting ATPase subunit beta-like [Homarus americanus]
MADQQPTISFTKGDAKRTNGEVDTKIPTYNRAPPRHRSTGDAMKSFWWNPEKREFLGRTGVSWGKIGLFYLVFYSFLAAFFAACMAAFYTTLDTEHTPKYTGDESLLANPGLGIRPRTNLEENHPVIIYSPSGSFSYGDYIDSIDDFFKTYNNRSDLQSKYINCKEDDHIITGEICDFDLGMTKTSCTQEDNWGYTTNSPCILLKLNKMIGWLPHPTKHFSSLPQGLQDHINSLNDTNALSKNVWVWCESQEVEIEQPAPGLPLSFFPYTNQPGYLAPFVMVRLIDVPLEVDVKVKCRAWADNILPRMNRRALGQLDIDIKLH